MEGLHLPMVDSEAGFIFRPMRTEDAPSVFEIHTDPETRRFTRLLRQNTLDDIVSWLNYYPHYQRHGFGLWALESVNTGQLVGICGLRVRKDLDNRVDLSYRIHPDYRHQGVASTAVAASVQFGFEVLKLPSILAQVHEDNTYSKRIMEKTGFTAMGKEDVWITYEALRAGY